MPAFVPLKMFSILLMATPTPPSATSSNAPSVAIMGLGAKSGVHPDVAEQLTETLVAAVRRTHRFSRVVSSGEVQALVSFEQQKQILACEASSCMAEIAGSLGVEYLITGTLGRLGKTWLFNVKLLNARTALGEGSVSRPITGEDESVLLESIDSIVGELFAGSSIPPAPQAIPPPTTGGNAAAPQATSPGPRTSGPGSASSPTTTPAESGGSSMLPMLLRVVGAGGLGAGLLVVLGGVISGAVAGSSLALGLYSSQSYVPGMARFRMPMAILFYAGVVLACVGLPLSLLVGVVGAGGLGASMFVG